MLLVVLGIYDLSFPETYLGNGGYERWIHVSTL